MMASFKQTSAVFDYFEMPDHTSGNTEQYLYIAQLL